jgi:hypothetical protein
MPIRPFMWGVLRAGSAAHSQALAAAAKLKAVRWPAAVAACRAFVFTVPGHDMCSAQGGSSGCFMKTSLTVSYGASIGPGAMAGVLLPAANFTRRWCLLDVCQ